MLTGSSSRPVFRSVKYSGIQACTDGIHLFIAGIIAVNRRYHWGEIFTNASNALKHITNPHDVDIINAADIRTILRRHADEELQETKKKYLNDNLHGALHEFATLVKKRYIALETPEIYNEYIDGLFTSEQFTHKVDTLKSFYGKMENKYSESNWNAHWKELCDGKIVFHKTISDLKSRCRVTPEALEDNIIDCIKKSPDSSLNQWWTEILQKYN